GGRALVTANVKDFMPLDTQYKTTGRQHAGLILVTTKTFPQDRSFTGAFVDALAALLSTPEGSGPDRVVSLLRCSAWRGQRAGARRCGQGCGHRAARSRCSARNLAATAGPARYLRTTPATPASRAGSSRTHDGRGSGSDAPLWPHSWRTRNRVRLHREYSALSRLAIFHGTPPTRLADA